MMLFHSEYISKKMAATVWSYLIRNASVAIVCITVLQIIIFKHDLEKNLTGKKAECHFLLLCHSFKKCI